MRWIGLLLFVPLWVQAHPGRTDAEGCHVESATGVRHCHTKKPDESPAKKFELKNHDNSHLYLEGFDTSNSIVLPISATNPLEFQTSFNARLSVIPGKKAIAHIDAMESYLFEWDGTAGFRIFSSEPPAGYGTRRPHDFVVRVYKNGLLIDDGTGVFEQGFRLQKRLHGLESQQIEEERKELQRKIDRGIVDVGMSEYEVIMILGFPDGRVKKKEGEFLFYEGTLIHIRDGVVDAVSERIGE